MKNKDSVELIEYTKTQDALTASPTRSAQCSARRCSFC